jgi:serine/threonine protein kinase
MMLMNEIFLSSCAGGELFTECILEEKFNEADVRLLMSQILEGLVYLHEKNIVHLDLKVYLYFMFMSQISSSFE